MFKTKQARYLPNHIEYATYHRDKQSKIMPEEDKVAIEKFYKLHKINYKGLTNYQQVIVFKRTVNFIFIVAHFFDKKEGAKFVNPMEGKDKGFGVVRSQAYLFYKSGELLYELDHDYQKYEDEHFTQTEDKKLLKRNYELHEELNNSYLTKIGECGMSMPKFDRACHDLIKNDIVCKSVDFITKE